jgi:hypothetical protein
MKGNISDDSNDYQAQKPNQDITLPDRKSLICRQRSAPTRSHAQEIKIFEAILKTVDRGSMQSDVQSPANTLTYLKEFQDDYQFADRFAGPVRDSNALFQPP